MAQVKKNCKVVFIDTETAGFKKPMEPIEVATMTFQGELDAIFRDDYRVQDALYEERFLNMNPMEWGALATHHILPQDLIRCGKWFAPTFHKQIKDADFLIGHNVDFDWEVVGFPEGPLRIDTLALSRYSYPDMDSHKLGAMIYRMLGPSPSTRDMLKDAHSAAADVRMTLFLLRALLAAQPLNSWADVYRLSELGRIPMRWTFGKYGPKDGQPGKRIRDTLIEDPGYIKWCRQNLKDDKYLIKAFDNPR